MIIRYIPPLLTAFILFIPTLNAQQRNNTAIKNLNRVFSNLPETDRLEYSRLTKKSMRYLANNRIFDALVTAHQMHVIFKDDPNSYILLANIYLKIQKYDSARKNLKQAEKMLGITPDIAFAYATIEFNKNNWNASIKHNQNFIKISSPYTKKSLLEIADFKIFLALLSLDSNNTKNKKLNIIHKKGINHLKQKYTFLDDSPFFYYAQAAIKIQANDSNGENEWRRKANKIFSNSSVQLAQWNNALNIFITSKK